MCNRYVSPEAGDMERYWHVGGRNPWRSVEVFPRRPGPFIRRAVDSTEPARELVVGQWGLVPWFAKTAKLTYSTNNARFEGLTTKASTSKLGSTASCGVRSGQAAPPTIKSSRVSENLEAKHMQGEPAPQKRFLGPLLLLSFALLCVVFAGESNIGFGVGYTAGKLFTSLAFALPIFLLLKYATKRGMALNWSSSLDLLSYLTLAAWFVQISLVMLVPRAIAGLEQPPMPVKAVGMAAPRTPDQAPTAAQIPAVPAAEIASASHRRRGKGAPRMTVEEFEKKYGPLPRDPFEAYDKEYGYPRSASHPSD